MSVVKTINRDKSVDLAVKNAPSWRLIDEFKTEKFDWLLNIYKKDPRKAKILYSQNKSSFQSSRTVLFEWPNGDFKIARITKILGMSSNNRIYNKENISAAIIYKNKKFYFMNNETKKKHFCLLTYHNLETFTYTEYLKNIILDYLVNKFGWIRFISEYEELHYLTFNSIINNKLYSYKEALRHVFGVSYPIAKKILSVKANYAKVNEYIYQWKLTKRYLINLEAINLEILKSKFLDDTLLMAEALGYKINSAWSLKRLKSEHDKWSKEIVSVILEHEPKKNLEILDIFKKFQKFSGYEMFLTNHDLIEEGKRMAHCVGTYSRSVNYGHCAIFKVHGCTLELQKDFDDFGDGRQKLCIKQYRDFNNTEPPEKYLNEVELMVNNFNYEINKEVKTHKILPLSGILNNYTEE